MKIIVFVITLLACAFGKICGMGGGVIIKPVVDALGIFCVASVNFYSSCTVLAMSGTSVFRSLKGKEKTVDLYTSSLLGIGAAFGGLFGKNAFQSVAGWVQNQNLAGGVQALLLFLLTLGTFLYTKKKNQILGYEFHHPVICIGIGIVLGSLGAFLGIGGGPFNMAALYFFFSMPTKKAAENSLYIIMISQFSGLLKTVVDGSVPTFQWNVLIGMMICGVLGSELGRHLNKKLSEEKVSVLFHFSMVLVMALCIYNFLRFVIW